MMMMMMIIATVQHTVINAVTRIYTIHKWTSILRLRVDKLMDNGDKVREEYLRAWYNPIYLVSCIFY